MVFGEYLTRSLTSSWIVLLTFQSFADSSSDIEQVENCWNSDGTSNASSARQQQQWKHYNSFYRVAYEPNDGEYRVAYLKNLIQWEYIRGNSNPQKYSREPSNFNQHHRLEVIPQDRRMLVRAISLELASMIAEIQLWQLQRTRPSDCIIAKLASESLSYFRVPCQC